MTKRVFQSNWLPLVCSALLLLTLLAGIFLYRAINRASEADRMQQRDLLETAMRGTASEFNNAIQEVHTAFRTTPRMQNDAKLEVYALELYQSWRGTTQRVPLIGSLSLGAVTNGTAEFRRYVAAQEPGKDTVFTPIEWPAALHAFRATLPEQAREPARIPPQGFAFVLVENRPVIALPLMTIHVTPNAQNRRPPAFFGPPWGRPGRGMPPPNGAPLRNGPPPWMSAGQAPPWATPGQAPPWVRARNAMPPGRGDARLQLSGWCFVEFDAAYLRDHLLPALQRKHFSGADLSHYVLTVKAGNAPLYTSDATFNLATTADATEALFAPLSRFGEGFDARLAEAALLDSNAQWRLAAYHRAGSLAAMLQRERRNNLLIGFGLLFLLSATVSLLTWTAQRSRMLARRQMEFVAGVSHELRTPLTVIQSAGFNLAQGRVTEPVRVAQYGATIQYEGRRLSDMVEQMLSYAGIQAGKKQYEFQPVCVDDVIERALSEYETAFTASGWQIEKAIDDDLPLVNADQQALESAVKNLLQNALKYAATGKWLKVSAQSAGQEIQITVADHGPGIAAEDRRNLFEPFYRGQGMAASAISGAGLGLSILQEHIKAHGGRITVASSDTGAAFTLHLPAMPRQKENTKQTEITEQTETTTT